MTGNQNSGKIVIIVNGQGGAGKDTLCDFVSMYYRNVAISSITPIKEIAHTYGWNGEKNEASRKFLADLKKTFSDYNNLPTEYLKREYKKFETDDAEILFVQIREGDEIDKFRQYVTLPCVTLLIRRDRIRSWGNGSDDNVEAYHYDYYFENMQPLHESQREFAELISRIREEKGAR